MKQMLIKTTTFVCAFSAGLVTVSAWAEEKEGEASFLSDLEFTVGAGVGYAPDYEGSDDYKAVFMPNLEVVWKDRVSLSPSGLMVDALQTENLTLGLGVGMTDGRDASDNDALKGLGDIDTSVEGTLYGSYQYEFWEIAASYNHDLGDGHEGSVLTLESNFFIPVSDEFMVVAGPDVTWASEDYMQSFFGISSKQAASSAYSKYDAGSGFKNAGFHMMGNYEITESISLNAIFEYQKMLGDSADSPIVKDKGSDNQMFGGLILNYAF